MFSSFLLFHTKTRNRLGVKKVLYSVLAKRAVCRKDEAEELAELQARGLRPGDVQSTNCTRIVDPKERQKLPTVQYTEIRALHDGEASNEEKEIDSVNVVVVL